MARPTKTGDARKGYRRKSDGPRFETQEEYVIHLSHIVNVACTRWLALHHVAPNDWRNDAANEAREAKMLKAVREGMKGKS